MKITTRYKSNANGTGKIEARTGDTRKTVTYDHTASPERNHGAAAGELILALDAKGVGGGILSLAAISVLDAGAAQHDSEDNGGVHRFTL